MSLLGGIFYVTAGGLMKRKKLDCVEGIEEKSTK
jgi:hypothetical protein